MRVNSLGYRTDLIFPTFDGEILDRGDYLVIRTPHDPGYYWGNFLLFPDPPRDGDFENWRGLFADEIGAPPDIRHETFGWDSPDGDQGVTESFIAAGFRLCCNVVMTTAEPHAPRRRSTEVEVRALESDGDWRQALDNQIACMEPEFEVSAYRLHRQHQIDRYRRMANAGIGHWYGAFIGHRLVADLGIFHDRGIGRFQMVQTHPDFRRRGIGSTLVFKSARLALAEDNFDVLVILAEEDSAAQRLYKSIDFVPVERQLGLERWPND